MTHKKIFELDEQLERFDERVTSLTAAERKQYQSLRQEMFEAEVAYYMQGHRPSIHSIVTSTVDRYREHMESQQRRDQIEKEATEALKRAVRRTSGSENYWWF